MEMHFNRTSLQEIIYDNIKQFFNISEGKMLSLQKCFKTMK